MIHFQKPPELYDGLRLHQNENTGGCSPRVLEALASLRADQIGFYPPYTAATDACARYLGVSSDRIALTNGLDEGILACLDPRTGKRKWKGGRYGHGQLLLAGDLLVILSESGKLALVEAAPDAEHELGSFQAIEGKTWNNFAIADGRAYVRNADEMACYDLPRK